MLMLFVILILLESLFDFAPEDSIRIRIRIRMIVDAQSDVDAHSDSDSDAHCARCPPTP